MGRLRLSRAPWLGLLLLLLLLVIGAVAPVAAQDGTTTTSIGDGRVRVAVDGDLTLPAGDSADLVVVIRGDARIEGAADVVAVIDGTLTMTSGSIAERAAIIRGTADLQAGATVTNDVLELDSTVTVDPAATVGGEVRSIAVDLAGVGIALGVLGLIAWGAFALLTWVAGLALAAFGSRQVRSAEWLISREPLKTLLAGIGMVVLPPIVAVLLMATVVLLPVGLALLFIVWPVLAFLGWLVGATWIGDWILRTAGRDRPERRPYLAVTIGLVVATFASLIPLVGAVISLFGTGAVALAGWRMLRTPETPPAAAAFAPIVPPAFAPYAAMPPAPSAPPAPAVAPPPAGPAPWAGSPTPPAGPTGPFDPPPPPPGPGTPWG
jgi:hypothetical protein